MATILPVQRVFDKDIPGDFGNAEYHQERELLITIDNIITQAALEEPVIRYFLDVAYLEKSISLFGTGKSTKLTCDESRWIGTNAVMALRTSILRKRLNLSLRKFSLALSHSDLYKWFCGINRFSIPRVPGKSTIGDLENFLPSELLEETGRRLLYAVQDKHSPILDEPLDCSQIYFDCTCICANIHYPIDWVLLRDCTRTLMKATIRIRKTGLCHRMPYEPAVFISKMNKLCMEMTFAKRKKGAKKLRKGILRRMKKLVKCVSQHATNHLKLLEAKWQTTDISRCQSQQIIGQIANVTGKLSAVIRQAHERIIGERKVAGSDKILSIYEDDVNVIVRHKAGADVEFGNTLYLAEQDNGLIVDWKFFCRHAPGDSKMVKDSHVRIEERLGIDVKLMAADRGFDSPGNRQHLESNDIFNAICPRSPGLLTQRLEEDKFRTAQNRRSQTEARISILSNCFCGSPMKQKGFDHRHIHMGLSILSHNLWVAARVKITRQALQEAA
jgi:hypothetical protein